MKRRHFLAQFGFTVPTALVGGVAGASTVKNIDSKPTELEVRAERLRELIDIQCSNGNWDWDPYMHGMANGMILALSVLDDGEPDFLAPPEKWGSDGKPSVVCGEVSDV